MNHVRLGEYGAASGDARGTTGFAGGGSDLFYGVAEAGRLLIDERAGTSGAVATGGVVDDAQVLRVAARFFEVNVLGGFAAHLEHGAHARIEDAHALGDGAEFVLEIDAEDLGDELAAGAGDANAFDALFGNPLIEFAEQIEGGLNGAAMNAAITRKDEWPAGHLTFGRELRGEEGIAIRDERGKQITVARISHGGQFEADRTNVQTDIYAHARLVRLYGLHAVGVCDKTHERM